MYDDPMSLFLPFSMRLNKKKQDISPNMICRYLECLDYFTKYEKTIYDWIKLYENIIKNNMKLMKQIFYEWSIFYYC